MSDESSIIKGVNLSPVLDQRAATSYPFRQDYASRMVVMNTIYLTSISSIGDTNERATSTPAINTSAVINIPNQNTPVDPYTKVIQINKLIGNIASTSAGGTVTPVTISLTFDVILKSTGAVLQTITLFSIRAGIGASGTYTYEWNQPIMLYYDASLIARNVTFTVSAGGANVYSSASAIYKYVECN